MNTPHDSRPEPCTAASPVAPRSTQPFLGRLQRRVAIAMVLCLLLSAAVLGFTLTGVYLYDRHLSAIVKETESAGTVLTVNLSSGCPTRTLVQTETGFYAVNQGISLVKGKPLTVELLGNQDRYLCDHAHRCARLL
ncbi:hypothetical protein [Rhodoferax sp.]|uniref:hypothetical protein n=1 Tax=Rhodoferax sp. TaxID=50421 RepID=UPI00277470CE|nr:hypothetical protein [Rhodoferax sp.]